MVGRFKKFDDERFLPAVVRFVGLRCIPAGGEVIEIRSRFAVLDGLGEAAVVGFARFAPRLLGSAETGVRRASDSELTSTGQLMIRATEMASPLDDLVPKHPILT